MRAKQAAMNAQKEADEAAESKRLDGKMLIFLNKAQENETHNDFSFSGLLLGSART
jgi:tRNA pseudouridine-54 N-methylase